jgi:hypothetical protein
LLRRSTSGVITFREFVAVAHDCWRDRPEQTATYLAALVALDMGSPDEDACRLPIAPSSN